jgi:hypothetical protein
VTEIHSDRFGVPTRIKVAAPRSGSRLGRRAMTCAALVFVPLAPLYGLLLSARALASRADRSALAAAAFLVALIGVAAQSFIGYRGYGYIRGVNEGPRLALDAAVDGDVRRFEQAFPTVSRIDDDARRFFAEVDSRYGRFVSLELADEIPTAYLTAPSDRRHYRLFFERGIVPSEAAFRIETDLGPAFLESSLVELRIVDRERGDLAWPPVAGSGEAIGATAGSETEF